MTEIVYGDCRKTLKEYKDNAIHHTITSPPYNFGKRGRDKQPKYTQFNDNRGQIEYYQYISQALEQIIRVTEYYVFFIFQILTNNKIAYCQIFNEFKYNIKDVIIWQKTNPQPAIQRTCLSSSFEVILILCKEELAQKRTFERVNWNNREKGNQVYNIISGTCMEHGIRNIYKNKAVFPEYLINYIITKFTQENDTILDPFMGSGTVGVVCNKLHRNFIGIDIDIEQCSIAQERINNAII